MSEDNNAKQSRETRRKDVKEMTPDEMRSEIYRLYRVRAEQSVRIKELEVTRDTLHRNILSRLREDFRQVMRDVVNGRA
jgi:hypothetical protein